MLGTYEKKVITAMENKRLKLNADLRGYTAGMIIKIQTDKSGVPLDRYWRDRLKDAESDNCVELIKGSKK